jgi:hypothetical protein
LHGGHLNNASTV